MLTLTLSVPSKFLGKTYGLTGLYDGNKENDLSWKNRTSYIPANSTESTIFEWASTCKCFSPVLHNYLCLMDFHQCKHLCSFSRDSILFLNYAINDWMHKKLKLKSHGENFFLFAVSLIQTFLYF